MMLLWLVLIARCSGSDEIPLDRAVQSSTWSPYIAAWAIDGNLGTSSGTNGEDPDWLIVYFTSSSIVERVVVESGHSKSLACVWTVSVYDKETATVCGTYASKDG